MIRKHALTVLVVLAVLFPVKRSEAFVIPLFYAAYAAAAGASITPWLAGVTTVVSATIVYFEWNPAPSEPESIKMSVTLDPNTPLTTPPGWTPPVTGNQEPTPPQVTNGKLSIDVPNAGAHEATDMSTLANKVATALQQNSPVGRVVTVTGLTATQFELSYAMNGNSTGSDWWTPIKNCDSGYTNTSGTCQLTQPENVIKPLDGLCEFVTTPTGFKASPNDDDCSEANVSTLEGSTIATQQGQERLQVTKDANGNVSIIQKVFDPSTSKTRTYTASVVGTTVASVSSTEESGDTTPVNTIPGGSTGGGTGTVNFPNDYSRAGEANSAAQKIVDKLDPLTSSTGASDGSGTDPEFTDGFGTTFAPLRGWQLPLHSSTCPTANFTVWSHQFNLDAQCTVFNDVKAPLSLAMVAAWVIAALLIVLGA